MNDSVGDCDQATSVEQVVNQSFEMDKGRLNGRLIGQETNGLL